MVQGIKDGRQENSSQMRENPPLGSGIPIPLIELESREHRTFLCFEFLNRAANVVAGPLHPAREAEPGQLLLHGLDT